MPGTHVVIDLLGEVALLLWGIHMIRSGVMRAFGSELRRGLGIALQSRWRAFLAGLGVTAVLQSSTATAMMATSFTSGRLVGLTAALAVMLGANVGTTLIVQVLAFDITLVYPLLIFAGVAAFRRGRRSRSRDLGRVAIGLGLMLLALHLLVQSMEPVETARAMRTVLQAIADQPLLNLLIAAVFTWAAHSSVATMLFVMSLADAGLLAGGAALAMVIGANLGSALNPVLAASGDEPAALRLPLGNLLTRLAGAVVALPLLQPVQSWLAALSADPGQTAANFHTAFNLALALAFILPLPALAQALERLLPDRPAAEDPGRPRYLDAADLAVPAMALADAAREAMRMSDVVGAMLRGSREVFAGGDRDRLGEVARMDDTLDRLHTAIQLYLAGVGDDDLDGDDAARLDEILGFALNLEHIGDIVDRDLMTLAAKAIRQRIALSVRERRDLDELHARLLDHLQLAVAVFMHGDAAAARRLVAEKDRFRSFERDAADRHFAKVRGGRTETLEGGTLLLDAVRDLKRIEAHLAATVYPLLERSGDLMPSRLAP